VHLEAFLQMEEAFLQFRETSKNILDMMTFLCETRKINLNNENTEYNLQLLLI
jgi:hypothetical protein